MSDQLQSMLQQAKAEVEELSPQQALAFIKEHSPFIVDVREPAEFSSGFVPGGDNIPRGVLEFKIGNHEEAQDKTRPIFVYCQSGMRGVLAAQSLKRLGYANVKNLLGGFEQWVGTGLPTDKDIDSW